MGCMSSTPSDYALAKSVQTEKYFKIETVKYKILLLGAAQCGKSALLKQLRKLHGRQFDQSELLAAKPYITQNTIEAMRTLAIYSDILADQGCDTRVLPKNTEIRDRVARMSDKQKFTEEHYNDFVKLWSDPHIRKTLEYQNQLYLIDSVEYLFENMHKYHQDEYIPTFTDLIHSYQRTVGVNKIKFVLNDRRDDVEEIYEIFDLGGDKHNRRRWMHCMDNTAAVIFVVALSGYNELLWNDSRNTRMNEAIWLFRGIVNLEILKNSHIIVFLNKSDLFEKKIYSGKYPVKEWFEDLRGGETKENVIEFFKQIFLDQRRDEGGGVYMMIAYNWCRIHCCPDDIVPLIIMFMKSSQCKIPSRKDWNPSKHWNKRPRQKIHFHVTCATDTACVDKMFESCRKIVIKDELIMQGFL